MTETMALETTKELLRIKREKILRDITDCEELECGSVLQVVTALLIREELKELLLELENAIELLEELK